MRQPLGPRNLDGFHRGAHDGRDRRHPLDNLFFEQLLSRGDRCFHTPLLRLATNGNGVLLGAKMMAHLRQHDVLVGVSVDGTREDHDRQRVTHAGRGTFDRVAAALELLGREENRGSYGGLLCTVDAATDPVATTLAIVVSM